MAAQAQAQSQQGTHRLVSPKLQQPKLANLETGHSNYGTAQRMLTTSPEQNTATSTGAWEGPPCAGTGGGRG